MTIDDIIFVDSKICPNCVKNKRKIYKIIPEHIFAGFNFDKNISYILCPECFAKIEPVLYYLKKSQSKLKIYKFKLIPPHKLIQDIDIIINQEREIYFYKRNEEDINFMNIYLSIIIYFQLLDLPLFVLYIPKNNDKSFINELTQDINQNKLRKMTKRDQIKSGNNISEDKNNRSPEHSSNNESEVIRDINYISNKTTLSNISKLESEIWKNIQLNSKKEEIVSDIINQNEKKEYTSRLKEMKVFFNKLFQYFIMNSKEKIEICLNKLAEKQENSNDIRLHEENENEKNNNKISSNITITNNNNINLLDKRYDNLFKENDDKIKTNIIKSNIIMNNDINNNVKK